jgi:proton-coupled amino acid transporter
MKSVTYEIIGLKIWGKTGRFVIAFLLWCAQISVFIGAFLMTTEIIHDLLCLDPEMAACMKRGKVILVVSVLSMIIAIIPSLKTFAYISTVSMFIIFVSMIIIFVENFNIMKDMDSNTLALKEKAFFYDFGLFPQSLGILLYSFEGITLYLPLKNTYKKQKNFHSFFLWTMLFVAFFIFFINIPSYFAFFDQSREIIFLNFDPSFTYLHIMKLIYLAVVFLSNPINLFPLYRSFLSYTSIKKYLLKKSKGFVSVFKLFLRFFVTLFCIFIGALVPSFINFISFVGSFFFSLLGIIIPVLLYLTHFAKKKELKKGDGIFKGFVLSVSFAIFAVASVFSFKTLITLHK